MITVGIDEVGRGCWAGPLVASAVALSQPIPGLKDSKKLSKRQREQLATIIQAQAVAVGLGWIWPAEIDRVGLSAAVRQAMQAALAVIASDHDEIIVDGNINYLADNPKARAVIKADDIFPSVSAASIVAKVARDNYMAEIAGQYPGYGFEQHVGYGTAAHIASLKSLGVSDMHRRSYKPIKTLLGMTV